MCCATLDTPKNPASLVYFHPGTIHTLRLNAKWLYMLSFHQSEIGAASGLMLVQLANLVIASLLFYGLETTREPLYTSVYISVFPATPVPSTAATMVDYIVSFSASSLD